MEENKAVGVVKQEEPKSAVDKLWELKKTKWEAFCKRYAARIAFYPAHNGKKTLPAAWVDKIQDWIWISRAQKRHIEKRSKR